ncbi:MAG: diguanylate cyclase [Anaerolineales bacterium]|nr:diguanylate cyclase [Anaerolineales bacterium]MCB9146728.1 diguanylate cyclase [Anaerolineales bacterium]
MKWLTNLVGIDPEDKLISVIPTVFYGVLVFMITIIMVIIWYPAHAMEIKSQIIIYFLIAFLYLLINFRAYSRSTIHVLFMWVNVIISAVGIGYLFFLLPHELEPLIFIMMIIAAMAKSALTGRLPSYTAMVVFSLFSIVYHHSYQSETKEWWLHISFLIAMVTSIETIQQLRAITKDQTRRIEIINEVSAHIINTNSAEELISLIDTTLKKIIDTDSYYIGMVKDNKLQMLLCHDEGEYFNGITLPLEGTLAEKVIKTQKPLFLPYMKNYASDSIANSKVYIGKNQGSESWIGVPLTSKHNQGVITISSYKKNAFTTADMHMLINVTERISLALDNIKQREILETEARLDSLTRVYNHGYFIKKLESQITKHCPNAHPTSLLMLDIDHFKKYNDTYGHRAGDEVLKTLCRVIQKNIKSSDSIGRWGGEEFAILLPSAQKEQAIEIAQRIQTTLSTHQFENEFHAIPSPTISIGIAEFPNEADDAIRLIDLADKRLYMAKEKGRNQVSVAPL